MLLHIGDTAHWITVNPDIVLGACAAFAATAGAVWLPDLRAVRRRQLQRIVLHGATLLGLVAIAPAVLPYDHLFPLAAHEAADAEAHEAHCHGAPSTCSDAPVASGDGKLLMADSLLREPALVSVLVLFTVPVLVGLTLRPVTRPPLASAAT